MDEIINYFVALVPSAAAVCAVIVSVINVIKAFRDKTKVITEAVSAKIAEQKAALDAEVEHVKSVSDTQSAMAQSLASLTLKYDELCGRLSELLIGISQSSETAAQVAALSNELESLTKQIRNIADAQNRITKKLG